MIETPYELFLRAPVGRFTLTTSSLVWCSSASLCGALFWGRPGEAETRAIFRIFDQYEHAMAIPFDVILDVREVEVVEPGALAVLFAWIVQHRATLRRRVRLQASVIRAGPVGFLFAGLLPALGRTHRSRAFTDPAEAFRVLAGDAGLEVALEVEGIAARARALPRELQLVRALLAARVDTTLDQAATQLGVSARSLQRILARQGTTFHDEVVAARLALAQKILLTTDQKLAGVGARVGISERALTLLFRAQTGLAPAEWRKRQRG
jgi:AraC-like DNA-binding protein